MAGRIRDEDVAAVKERASIEDVVREHVTLTRAGAGRLKGLCPFHDEKTASFTVRPAHGHWHCFGCNEGGDVISFVMRVDHLGFTEAVEALAVKAGVELRYEEGAAPRGAARGGRTRLLEAHRAAEEYYHAALLRERAARPARDFLRRRSFDGAAAARFAVGFAPRGGEELIAHLTRRGFTEDELVTAGLAARGRRGLYDRFRGRLLWPIRDITGSTVGFGARRIFEDDRAEAKYLNTAETPIYRKSSVLYGLDLAKKTIAHRREAVVVEGYTDVMACHLAGVQTAVATCGTAFGADHVHILRRLLRDDATGPPARTVFTFDGDAAGRKAAMRAFDLDQRWASQSYVAVAESGQDPCELRQSGGDVAVRLLVERAVPMFEFAVRTELDAHDLATAEGRVGAMRAVAPTIAGIRDRSLRPEYTRTVSGWIGVEVGQLADEVAHARRATPGRRARGSAPATGKPVDGAGPEPGGGVARPPPDLRDPVVDLEHQILQVLVQFPTTISDADAAMLASTTFRDPGHRGVLHAVLGQWGRHRELSAAAWVDAVADAAGEAAASLVSELSVAAIKKGPLDPSTGGPDARYVADLIATIRANGLRGRITDATGALRRAEGVDEDRARAIRVELMHLHSELANVKALAT